MKRYTKEHEWIEMISDTEGLVGITDYAQSELGEIVFVDIPDVDEPLNAMDVFGSIEAVKTVADLHSPVSGTIIEINGELEDCPELVNTDAEGRGWMIKISCDNTAELDDLMSEEEYKKFIMG